MVAATPHFDRMVPAAPDSVGPVRRELRRWARRQGANPAVQAKVALAFSEACTAIMGPEPPRAGVDGPLMIQAEHEGDELRVRVSHPSRGAPGPPVGVGYGFGLALMAQLCDRFEVRRRQGRPGTAVEMTFSLERAPEPAPARSFLRQPSRSTTRR
jgi:anti-sigma regulatory factor (Ser/Thr protein kinase)